MTAIQATAIAALVLFLAGCLVMHLRLRTRASLMLVVSIAALVAWYPLKASFLGHYAYVASGSEPGQLLQMVYRFYIAVGDFVEMGFPLLFGVTFLLSARAIMGPNNSFKPKPLRGSA